MAKKNKKYSQIMFSFDKEGLLSKEKYDGKLSKSQPKIQKLRILGYKPVESVELTNKEFLNLAVSEDKTQPTLMVSHNKWSSDGFRMHLLTNITKPCTCKNCKKGLSPRYEQLIPRDFNGKFEIDRDEVLRALNCSLMFSREGSNVVIFNIADEGLTIAGKDEEFGQSVNIIDSFSPSRSLSMEVEFNCSSFIDAIKSMGEKITVEYNTKVSPIMISNGNRSCLLMPMFIGK